MVFRVYNFSTVILSTSQILSEPRPYFTDLQRTCNSDPLSTSVLGLDSKAGDTQNDEIRTGIQISTVGKPLSLFPLSLDPSQWGTGIGIHVHPLLGAHSLSLCWLWRRFPMTPDGSAAFGEPN